MGIGQNVGEFRLVVHNRRAAYFLVYLFYVYTIDLEIFVVINIP